MLALTLAALLSQAEPNDGISDHVLTNMRKALGGATSAAIVTVLANDGKRVRFEVGEVVMGTMPEEIETVARAFMKQDVAPGTQLLAFFRGSGKTFFGTGHYELVFEGKIREYETEKYVARTRFEAKRVEVKPAPAKPAAPPTPSAEPAPVTSLL